VPCPSASCDCDSDLRMSACFRRSVIVNNLTFTTTMTNSLSTALPTTATTNAISTTVKQIDSSYTTTIPISTTTKDAMTTSSLSSSTSEAKQTTTTIFQPIDVQSPSLSTPAIIGIVVGGFYLALLIVGIIVYVVRRQSTKPTSSIPLSNNDKNTPPSSGVYASPSLAASSPAYGESSFSALE
jgi:hypothetical protein